MMERMSFGQFLKEIFSQMPKKLLSALPTTIISGILAWFFHTFLLVYVNEGFRPGSWLGRNILNTSGRLISSTVLWMILGSLIPALVSFIRGKNRGGGFLKLFTLPGEMVKRNRETKGQFMGLIMLSVTFSILAENILSGVSALAFGLVMANAAVSFLTGRGNFFAVSFRILIRDLGSGLLKRYTQFTDEDAMLVIGSGSMTLCILGLFRSFVFDSRLINNMLMLVFLIIAVVLLAKSNSSGGGLSLWIPLFFISAFLFMSQTIPADDGGWREAGGTLGQWLRSEGAMIATIHGLPPATAAIFGSLFANIFQDAFSGLSFTDESDSFGYDAQVSLPVQTGNEGEDMSSLPTIEYTNEDGSQTTFIRDPNTGNYISQDGQSYIEKNDAQKYLDELEQQQKDWADFVRRDEEIRKMNQIDAEQRARQSAQRQAEIDRERAIREEKIRQEEIERENKNRMLNKLAKKYGLPYSEGKEKIDYTEPANNYILRHEINRQKGLNEVRAKFYESKDKRLTNAIRVLETIETVSDAAVSIIASGTGVGIAATLPYFAAKEGGRGGVEGFHSSQSILSIPGNVLKGVRGGMIKGGIEGGMDLFLSGKYTKLPSLTSHGFKKFLKKNSATFLKNTAAEFLASQTGEIAYAGSQEGGLEKWWNKEDFWSSKWDNLKSAAQNNIFRGCDGVLKSSNSKLGKIAAKRGFKKEFKAIKKTTNWVNFSNAGTVYQTHKKIGKIYNE